MSVYQCDKCSEHLYRDDFGVRHDRSACLMDGGIVCRACDWHGMIATVRGAGSDGEVPSTSPAYVGQKARSSLERGFEMFERKSAPAATSPLQTRVWLDGDWSFSWSTLVKDDGEWKRYMHGGLIMHGPTPSKTENGDWSFSTWDYGPSVLVRQHRTRWRTSSGASIPERCYMAGWYLDNTETLLKHRVNFRKALEELHDPEFPGINLKKKELLRQSLECIEAELKKRRRRCVAN